MHTGIKSLNGDLNYVVVVRCMELDGSLFRGYLVQAPPCSV